MAESWPSGRYVLVVDHYETPTGQTFRRGDVLDLDAEIAQRMGEAGAISAEGSTEAERVRKPSRVLEAEALELRARALETEARRLREKPRRFGGEGSVSSYFLFMSCREGFFSETRLPRLMILGNPDAKP